MNQSFPSFVDLLTPEQVETVHQASLEILEEVGMCVEHEEARKILHKAGCTVDEDTHIVKFPRNEIVAALKKTPNTFTFYARDPQYDITVPGPDSVFTVSGRVAKTVDLETGKPRPSTLEDIKNTSFLTQQLPGYDINSLVFFAHELTGDNLIQTYTALKYCKKHLRMGSALNVGNAEKVMELGYTLAGSKEAFHARPFMSFGCTNVIDPLKLDQHPTEMLLYYCRKKMQVYTYAAPNAGLTAPFSLVGALIQLNAEFLANVLLIQTVNEGAEMFYVSLPTVADLRTGAYATGAIEAGMLSMASALMARYYKVPYGGCIGMTNAKTPDIQAGYENAMLMTGGMLAGMDIYPTALMAGLDEFDYGMMMIDNEVNMMLKRLKRGMEYSDQEVADAKKCIAEIGPGGSFLERPETVSRVRTLPFYPEISDRSSRVIWEANGAQNAYEKALQRGKELLSGDIPSLISPEKDDEIIAKFPELKNYR